MNMPLIGLWVKLLRIPYRLLFPAAMFFIGVGLYSVENNIFFLWVGLAFGLIGWVFKILDFSPAPILLGLVLGPQVEENFRTSMLISRGNIWALFQRPISGVLLSLCILLVAVQIFLWLRKRGILPSGAPRLATRAE